MGYNIDHSGRGNILNLIQHTNRRILNLEISRSIAKTSYLQHKAKNLHAKLFRLAPQHVINKFVHYIRNPIKSHTLNKHNNHHQTVLETKVNKLIEQQAAKIQYNKDWLNNISSVDIPDDVHMILALGPKFSVHHNKHEIPIHNLIADIEQIIPSINDQTLHNTIRGKAATIISKHLHTNNSYKTPTHLILHKAYNNTMKFLKNNLNLTITSADKGNVSIAMDTLDYNNILRRYFDDDTKYRKITTDPTKMMQLKNNSFTRVLLANQWIDKRTKWKLLTFTAQAPRPRATPKIHKPGTRVIINATNSPSYNMSRFLNDILTKTMCPNKYNIKNSFDLKNIIDNIILEPDDVMVSFDIVSMYEKIPLQEVYKSLHKRWDLIKEVTPVPWSFFKELVKFCVDETNYVMFDKKVYKQQDGLTIGGSVSGILADFVVTDLLDRAVEKAGFDPKLLVKYVDDTLAFVPREELENFFTILNGENRSIQFTCEIEDGKKIAYLDMLLERTAHNHILTQFYQKPTSKNRLLNYNSAHPMIQKSSTVYGTISRILTLTSDTHKHAAIKEIYRILEMNGYPGFFIKRQIEKFKKQTTTGKNSKNSTDISTITPKIYKGLTYSPHLSEELRDLFISSDETIEIGYKPWTTVGRITKSTYQPLHKLERHGIIYSVNCNDCAGIYIGQTGQKLKNRIKQHQSDYNSRTIKPNNTAAFQHARNMGHTFNYENTKIIKSEPNLQKRLTLEAININTYRETSINLKSDIDALNPAYTQLLHKSTYQ